ncbi:hypothetical protein ScPMuIL_017280 [Solemya velum]
MFQDGKVHLLVFTLSVSQGQCRLSQQACRCDVSKQSVKAGAGTLHGEIGISAVTPESQPVPPDPPHPLTVECQWNKLPVEETYLVFVPKKNHNDSECMKAKCVEIEKLKNFGIYEKVEDTGRACISTSWILWYKGEEIGALLVERGFDSPTQRRSTVRMLLEQYFWSCWLYFGLPTKVARQEEIHGALTVVSVEVVRSERRRRYISRPTFSGSVGSIADFYRPYTRQFCQHEEKPPLRKCFGSCDTIIERSTNGSMSKYTRNSETEKRTHETSKGHSRSQGLLASRNTDSGQATHGEFSRKHGTQWRNDINKAREKGGAGMGAGSSTSIDKGDKSERVPQTTGLKDSKVSDRQYHLRGQVVDANDNVRSLNGTAVKSEKKTHPESLYLKRYDKYVLTPSKEQEEKLHPSPSPSRHSGSHDPEYGTKSTPKSRPGQQPSSFRNVHEKNFGNKKLDDLRESWKKHRTDKEPVDGKGGDRSIELKHHMLYGSQVESEDKHSLRTGTSNINEVDRGKIHYGAKRHNEPSHSSKTQSDKFSSPSGKSLSTSPFPSRKADSSLQKDSRSTEILDSQKANKMGYKRAKTADVESLLYDDKKQSKESKPSSADASTVLETGDMSQSSRAERIARYKEERRKQLASMAALMKIEASAGASSASADVKPSLFTDAYQAKETSPISRSQSLRTKIDSPQKTSVTRTSSLRTDAENPRFNSPPKTRKDIHKEPSTFDKHHKSTDVSKKSSDFHSTDLDDDHQERGRRILPDKQKLEHRLALASMQGHERVPNKDGEMKHTADVQSQFGHHIGDVKATEVKKRRQLPSIEALIGSKERLDSSIKKKESINADSPVRYSADYSKSSNEKQDIMSAEAPKLRSHAHPAAARPLSDIYPRSHVHETEGEQQKDLSALSRTLLIKAARMAATEGRVPQELTSWHHTSDGRTSEWHGTEPDRNKHKKPMSGRASSEQTSKAHERERTLEHLKQRSPPPLGGHMVPKTGVSKVVGHTELNIKHVEHPKDSTGPAGKPVTENLYDFGWTPKQSVGRAASFHEDLKSSSTPHPSPDKSRIQELPASHALGTKQGNVNIHMEHPKDSTSPAGKPVTENLYDFGWTPKQSVGKAASFHEDLKSSSTPHPSPDKSCMKELPASQALGTKQGDVKRASSFDEKTSASSSEHRQLLDDAQIRKLEELKKLVAKKKMEALAKSSQSKPVLTTGSSSLEEKKIVPDDEFSKVRTPMSPKYSKATETLKQRETMQIQTDDKLRGHHGAGVDNIYEPLHLSKSGSVQTDAHKHAPLDRQTDLNVSKSTTQRDVQPDSQITYSVGRLMPGNKQTSTVSKVSLSNEAAGSNLVLQDMNAPVLSEQQTTKKKLLYQKKEDPSSPKKHTEPEKQSFSVPHPLEHKHQGYKDTVSSPKNLSSKKQDLASQTSGILSTAEPSSTRAETDSQTKSSYSKKHRRVPEQQLPSSGVHSSKVSTSQTNLEQTRLTDTVPETSMFQKVPARIDSIKISDKNTSDRDERKSKDKSVRTQKTAQDHTHFSAAELSSADSKYSDQTHPPGADKQKLKKQIGHTEILPQSSGPILSKKSSASSKHNKSESLVTSTNTDDRKTKNSDVKTISKITSQPHVASISQTHTELSTVSEQENKGVQIQGQFEKAVGQKISSSADSKYSAQTHPPVVDEQKLKKRLGYAEILPQNSGPMLSEKSSVSSKHNKSESLVTSTDTDDRETKTSDVKTISKITSQPHVASISQIHTELSTVSEKADNGVQLQRQFEKTEGHKIAKKPELATLSSTGGDFQSYEKVGEIRTTLKHEEIPGAPVADEPRVAPVSVITGDQLQLCTIPSEVVKVESHVVSPQTKVAPVTDVVTHLESTTLEEVKDFDNSEKRETAPSSLMPGIPKVMSAERKPQISLVEMSSDTSSNLETTQLVKPLPTVSEIVSKDHPNKGLSRTSAFRVSSKIAPAMMPVRESRVLYLKPEISKVETTSSVIMKEEADSVAKLSESDISVQNQKDESASNKLQISSEIAPAMMPVRESGVLYLKPEIPKVDTTSSDILEEEADSVAKLSESDISVQNQKDESASNKLQISSEIAPAMMPVRESGVLYLKPEIPKADSVAKLSESDISVQNQKDESASNKLRISSEIAPAMMGSTCSDILEEEAASVTKLSESNISVQNQEDKSASNKLNISMIKSKKVETHEREHKHDTRTEEEPFVMHITSSQVKEKQTATVSQIVPTEKSKILPHVVQSRSSVQERANSEPKEISGFENTTSKKKGSSKQKKEKKMKTDIKPAPKLSVASPDANLDDLVQKNLAYLKSPAERSKTTDVKVRKSLKKKLRQRSKSMPETDNIQLEVDNETSSKPYGDTEHSKNQSDVAPSGVHLSKQEQITQSKLPAGDPRTDKTSTKDISQTRGSVLDSESMHGADSVLKAGRTVAQDVHAASMRTTHSNSTDKISNVSRHPPSEKTSSSEIDENILIRKTVSSKYDSDQAQMSSDKQGYSDDTSDTSDILSMRRVHHGKLSRIQDTDSACSTRTDSDSTVTSSQGDLIETVKTKKRKDKSSLRKSNLNQSLDETDARRGRDSPAHDVTNLPHRRGMRASPLSSSSSLTKSEDLLEQSDKSSVDIPALTVHKVISLSKHDLAPLTTSTQMRTQASHGRDALRMDQSTSRALHSTLLDSKSVLPSKFTMPSKVSAAISKLYQGEQKRREASPVSDKKDTPQKFHRGADFSQLLQRFSGSDRSSCERSDGEQSTKKKFSLKRQEAYTVVSSSDEGGQDTLRKLPERTQSLRLKQTSSPDSRQVQRSSSLKHSSSQSHYNPNTSVGQYSEKKSVTKVESEIDSRVGKQPSSRKCLIPEGSDQPSDELASVLNQRSDIVTKQQKLGEQTERQRIHDKNIEKEQRQSAAGVEEVIVDRALASALKARRTETDNLDGVNASIPSKVQSESQSLNIASLDTSLAVLNAVTDDLSNRNRDLCSDHSDNIPHSSQKVSDMTQSLSSLKVDSPAQVAEFLKNVQQGSLDGSESKQSEKDDTSARVAGDNSSKSEIITKDSVSSKKEQKSLRTPSKSDLLTTNSSSLTRTESVGRSDSMDRQKQGILKRTPSLPKQTRAIVDKELASILNQRRTMEGNTDESDVDNESLASKSVYDDIRESARREKMLKKESQSSSEEEQIIPITQRIFQMETKLEEIKSCPLTPKSKSGQHTPKSNRKSRSEVMTPKSQRSIDETQSLTCLSGEQLMQKLSNLADKGKVVLDRREQFQRRSRDDWRTRTQPVTEEEIHEADNLSTVKSFRAEITKKASINVFEQSNKPEPPLLLSKKAEYPQPFRPAKVRRSRMERHKTLPVTAAEMNAIPEGETINFKGKFYSVGVRDSRADSGILSGSDVESYIDRESQGSDSLRSLEEGDDELVKLSVSAKASLFRQMAEISKEKKSCASGAKRYIDRKKRERSRTQPVTDDEVETAAKIADSNDSVETSQEQTEEEPKKRTDDSEEKDPNDELSSRSLAEKVKLFQTLKEAEQKTPERQPAPAAKRRNRKHVSRFSTQPVTIEEVEKAGKITPLAMSLVKPPDKDKLIGLPLQAQMEMMAQHAESFLAQSGARSGGSVGDLSHYGLETKGTSEEKDSHDVRSILRHESTKSSEMEMKGILKSDSDEKDTDKEPRSILKQHKAMIQRAHLIGQELKGILKQEDKERGTLKPSEIEPRGILKQQEADDEDDEPKSILKHKEISESGFNQSGKLKSAMRNEGSFESQDEDEPRSILKKESSFESRKFEPEKSAMRKSPPLKQEVHGILKKSDSSDVEETEHLKTDNIPSASVGKEEPEILATPERRGIGRENVRLISKYMYTPTFVTNALFSNHQSSLFRYLTQPAEIPLSNETPRRNPKMKYIGRHMTQPVTPDEKREAEAVGVPECVQKTGSVSDRLNALKKSGEEEWRKRLSKPADFDTPIKFRDKKESLIQRPTSIADRLNQLETSQVGWRGRVEESDAKQFTVAHKISSTGHVIEDSPLVSKLRNQKKDFYLKDSDSESSELTSPCSPTKEFASAKVPIPTEIIQTSKFKKEVEEEKKEPMKVEIPKLLMKSSMVFFSSKDVSEITEKIDVTVDDFNELFIVANDILTTTKKIRPKRRHTASKRNPLKTLSTSIQVKEEYEEVITGVAEKELRRMKTASIAKDAGFAQAALAGLASRENFAKVELRKVGESGPYGGLEPYKDLMLLHVKGRKHVQTRLVEPLPSSVNSGDCYVLVTPDKIINWVGEFSNVIEKSKAADVASFIQQKRDLGSRGTVVTVEEAKQHLIGGQQFWTCLGGRKDYQATGPPDEDELYESYIVETNMVYRLDQNKLLPYQEYWGMQPRFEMLIKDEVLVFDFGSELYVWQGKLASQQKRKLGIKLAQQLWEKGYDYSSCHINPLSPLKTEEVGGAVNVSSSRPAWCLFGKTNHNMETILFREKFQDWPDTSRLIKVKDRIDLTGSKSDLSDLKPYDAKLMLPVDMTMVTLVLEGSNVGRGRKWFEDMDGFIREQDIHTLGITIWHVLEYDHYKMTSDSQGQFHDGDTYVVKWKYMITTTGVKNRKGNTPAQTMTGRERYAYFFWQGKGSTINEKGASALMTVELDEERGPQIQVEEGKEPPCFLNLFDGSMIVHIGKREDESTNTQGPWRLYCVRNDFENEICLMEIPPGLHNFRSRSSFILLNVNTGLLYIWHGAKSSKHTRTLAKSAANKLRNNCPLEVGVHYDAQVIVTEMEEGAEMSQFWHILDVSRGNRSDYFSLLKDPSPCVHTLRLFHMSSVSGVFSVNEIQNASRSNEHITPFPFLQSELYKVSQPALFLVDNGVEMYLWHGWWPEGDLDIENVQTGSAKARYNVDRKCAMETTISYARERHEENPPISYVVYAGLEPMEFTNLFPFWEENETAKESSLKDGKEDGEKKLLIKEFAKVTRTRYTFAELTDTPLPEGVDPLRMESYLGDEEFEEVLELSKEKFYLLPVWKQTKIKQEAGLF